MVRDIGDSNVKNCLNAKRRQKLSEVIKTDGLNLKTFNVGEHTESRRGHLRLIDKCGLYMYTFFFLFKISWCGLYSGALYSPEITVIIKSSLESDAAQLADAPLLHVSFFVSLSEVHICFTFQGWVSAWSEPKSLKIIKFYRETTWKKVRFPDLCCLLLICVWGQPSLA